MSVFYRLDSILDKDIVKFDDLVPNEIGKSQWVQRPRGQASDLIVIDVDRCRRMRPWPLQCRLVRDTHKMSGSSLQWA